MKEIELGLHEVHASAKEKKNQGRDEAASETNGSKNCLVFISIKKRFVS